MSRSAHRSLTVLAALAAALVAVAVVLALPASAGARVAEQAPTTTVAAAPAEGTAATARSDSDSSAPLVAGVVALLVVVGGAGALYLRWARDQKAVARAAGGASSGNGPTTRG